MATHNLPNDALCPVIRRLHVLKTTLDIENANHALRNITDHLYSVVLTHTDGPLVLGEIHEGLFSLFGPSVNQLHEFEAQGLSLAVRFQHALDGAFDYAVPRLTPSTSKNDGKGNRDPFVFHPETNRCSRSGMSNNRRDRDSTGSWLSGKRPCGFPLLHRRTVTPPARGKIT